MKFSFTLIFSFLFFGFQNAQNYGVLTPTINGQNNWNIKIITTYTCSSNALKIGHSYSIDYTNNKLNLISCYTDGGVLPIVTTIKDTINIGTLPQGNYSLNYTVFISASMSNCVPIDTMTMTLPFYVGPSGIYEFTNNSPFKIAPNPLKESFLIFGSIKSDLEKLEIINLLGDKVLEINDPTLNSSINVASLPKGIYFLKTYVDKRSFVNKIIKE